MNADKIQELMTELCKDMEDIESFGTSMLQTMFYLGSLLQKPESERTQQDDIIVSLMGMVIETIVILSKQNKRISDMQSTLSRLVVRVSDVEHTGDGILNERDK